MIMTKERFDEIRFAINERINYYSNIGFTNLAAEFTKFRNFLDEIEAERAQEEKKNDG